MRWMRVVLLGAVLSAAWPQTSAAQNKPAPAPAPADDPDKDPNASQPDFTLIGLPTTLRVPRFSSAFRVTHRFLRPLGSGDFGDLGPEFNDYRWERQILEVGSNGLFQVDFLVFKRDTHGKELSESMSVLMYKPGGRRRR